MRIRSCGFVDADLRGTHLWSAASSVTSIEHDWKVGISAEVIFAHKCSSGDPPVQTSSTCRVRAAGWEEVLRPKD